MTLETSNRMSGARCSLVLFLVLFINAQTARTMNVHRLKRLTKDDICYETRKTAVTVQAFPKNLTIFEERTREKKCDSFPRCNEEPLVYHCVRSKDGIVEVCAPRRVIKGNYCAVFDKGIGRVVEDFSRPCPECPFKYQSADFVNYPACVKMEAMRTPNIVTDNTESQPKMNSTETSRSLCCNSNSTRCKRGVEEGCSETKTKSKDIFVTENQPASEEENSFHVRIIALIYAIAVLICISSLAFFVFKSRNKKFCIGKANEIQRENNQTGCMLSNRYGDEKKSICIIEPLILNGNPDIINA
ncbi:uncharacterized protein [Magallana gigas]|uniref:uncharacterized protein isoform X2 n=1 Tax=Magallana gigas TaxID=29159 RepID=UPI00148A2A89|nr:uncharacterized protein LOC117690809 isoform X4 [Crassostrea gigas]